MNEGAAEKNDNKVKQFKEIIIHIESKFPIE